MEVLIACEESQVVCNSFRNKGHNAYSCDVLECSGGKPEWHLKMDIFEAININKWDLMIAHPPCTRLTVTANKWYKPEYKDRFPNIEQERRDAIDFFMKLWNSSIPKIAIENPIGIMSSHFRKPDQIIQPYYFGDKSRKATCLWLRNLPKLFYSINDNLFERKTLVAPELYIFKNGNGTMSMDYMVALKAGENRSKIRSKTYQGIANAMADQWG